MIFFYVIAGPWILEICESIEDANEIVRTANAHGISALIEARETELFE